MNKNTLRPLIESVSRRMCAPVYESFNTDAMARLRKRFPEGGEFDAADVLKDIRTLGTPKARKAALNWLASGSVSPDDFELVRLATEIADRTGADPFAYRSPRALMAAFPDELEPKDDITVEDVARMPEMSDFKEHPSDDGSELVSFRVEDTKEGMRAVRRIIDSQLGPDRVPWCLSARDEDYAWKYWQRYSGLPKRIGFREGWVAGFFACYPFNQEMGDLTHYFPESLFMRYAEKHRKGVVDEWKSDDEGFDSFTDWLYEKHQEIWYDVDAELTTCGWEPEMQEEAPLWTYDMPNDAGVWWDLQDVEKEFLDDCKAE